MFKIVVRELLPLSEKAHIPTMTKKKVEEKSLSITTRNAKLRAIPIARRNSKSTKRKSLDEEKRLTTMIAKWPAYVESRLVHEHHVFFLNSMRTFRQMFMRYYDNKLRKKENRKSERESASSEQRDGSNTKMKEVRRKEKELL